MPAEPVFLDCDEVLSTPRFRLLRERFETSDGLVERPIIHHPGAVAVIACPSPGQLLMVRQYRYPLRIWTLEIPAGTRQAGEAPEVTAARELAEEAGFAPTALVERLRFVPAMGLSDEELIIYEAIGLQPLAGTRDHGELISAEQHPIADLPQLYRAGLIRDAKTLLAMSLLGLDLSELKP